MVWANPFLCQSQLELRLSWAVTISQEGKITASILFSPTSLNILQAICLRVIDLFDFGENENVSRTFFQN